MLKTIQLNTEERKNSATSIKILGQNMEKRTLNFRRLDMGRPAFYKPNQASAI